MQNNRSFSNRVSDGGISRQMIAEHSAFLSAALDDRLKPRRGVVHPRIPRLKAKQGGFSRLMAVPGARAAVDHWWQRVLSVAESYKN